MTDKDNSATYLNFSSRNAYIAQLFQHDNEFIAHEVGKAVFVKSLLELDILRETLLDLYRWKKSLIQNSNKVSLAYINQCYKYTLSDISQSNSAPSTPPHSRPPQAAKIFLSPSNAGKRSRTVFESDK
ncbi:unnamed protein product [Mucor hiemalis]